MSHKFKNISAIIICIIPFSSVLDGESPDCHDTDHLEYGNPPDHVYNKNIDILEYKVAHDSENLYVYIRAKGQIGRTDKGGRFYVITTIDVDQNDSTGYWLHEGGYWPTTPGYDVNMEMEFYDGHWNHGSYLNHGCNDSESYSFAYKSNIGGITTIQQGNYSFYTEYDYFTVAPTVDEQLRCQDGLYVLPSKQEFICFSTDKAPGPFPSGSVRFALSEGGDEIEYGGPFSGFMRDASGRAVISLGSKLDLSVSLETSGEFSVPRGSWASDTAAPILGYELEAETSSL